jgi:hypothetical protein
MNASTLVVLLFVIALVAWLGYRTWKMAKKDLREGCCGDCARCANRGNPINCKICEGEKKE